MPKNPVFLFYLLTFVFLPPFSSLANELENAPFHIPSNFQQTIVADESNLDIYPGSDWSDMNTVNETGRNAGRFLYRTHEVRPVFGKFNYSGGAVSVIDLQTSKTSILAQFPHWEAIDGIVWTPWETLLVVEEVQDSKLPDRDQPAAVRGHVYEIFPDPSDLTKAKSVHLRANLGALAHEGIEYDEAGNIYLVDEDFRGGIYKFMPENYGDLANGQLYSLKIVKDNGDNTGEAEWIALDMNIAVNNAHGAAMKAGASNWCRPEDLERIGNILYVALTCHEDTIFGQRRENRVLSITLQGKPVVRNFVKEKINVPEENEQNGFAKPDNLADGPNGTLWIAEDNSPSDIWIAYPDKNNDGYADKVELFATLKDKSAEASGIYFADNFETLYVNVQHTADGNDKTVKIGKK